MYDLAVLWSWAEFAVRWLHVITAIAWIGSSFYFIALDLGLNRNIPGPADGENRQPCVNGGGNGALSVRHVTHQLGGKNH